MKATLKETRWLNRRDILFTLTCPDMQAACPGQFVQVRVRDGLDPFFRRPFSIFSANAETGVLKLLVRVVGRGTALMAEWEPGLEVDILGPLGNRFTWEETEAEFILVGGGCGLAPVNFLGEQLAAQGKKAHLLFSPKRDSVLAEIVTPGIADITFSENRSTLAAVLDGMLAQYPGTRRIYACGPDGLMALVAQCAARRKVPVQLSLEARMACGYGICVGCVVPIRNATGDFDYKKVCHDGPVFDGKDVLFDE